MCRGRFSSLLFSGACRWARIAVTGLVLSVLGQAHAGWTLPAENLSTAGQHSEGAEVVMDAAGNAVAVWLRSDGTNYIVQTSRYTAGSATWGAIEHLSDAGADASRPEVAADGAGNAIAVWSRWNGANWVVQGARFDVGTSTWSPWVGLSAAGQSATDPQIAMDGAGNGYAVWRRWDGGHWLVQAALYSAAADVWGVPVTLSAAGQSANDPQVAADAAGRAMVVWSRWNGSANVIQAARHAAGAWGAAVNVSAGPDDVAPYLAVGAGGDALAVWEGWDGSNWVVRGTRYAVASDAWGAVATLSAPGRNADSPSVGMDAAGNAVAVWRRFDGSDDIVQAARQAAGSASWGPVADLSAAGGTTLGPQVAVNAAGSTVALWSRDAAAGLIVQGAWFSPATAAWSTATDLSAVGGSAYYPEPALDDEGRAVAVWVRDDGGYYIAQAALYAGTPAAQPSVAITSVPALGPIGLGMLSGLLGLAGWLRARRPH